MTERHPDPREAHDLGQLTDLIAVALALGMTVPAPAGTTVWLADILDTTNEETTRSQLGIFTSHAAALATARTWVLDEWNEDASPPWFAFSDNERDLEIPAALAARTAWLAGKSDQEIVDAYFTDSTWRQLRLYDWTVQG